MEYQRSVRPVLLLLAAACAVAPPAPPGSGSPAEVLGRFAAAAEAGRWEEAWPLLSARWRARSSPAQIPGDWQAAGPVGREAAARVRALLAAGARPVAAGAEATLPVGPGRAARLVAEGGLWRVDALE
jgi:hypothetical protein